jgi:hypothetical protein
MEQESTFGAPLTVPTGSAARSASQLERLSSSSPVTCTESSCHHLGTKWGRGWVSTKFVNFTTLSKHRTTQKTIEQIIYTNQWILNARQIWEQHTVELICMTWE